MDSDYNYHTLNDNFQWYKLLCESNLNCELTHHCCIFSRLSGCIYEPESQRLNLAQSESLLLKTYNVTLPPTSVLMYPVPESAIDRTSIKVLEYFHPAMARSHVPVSTIGDGNCLFRTVSLAMFGTQNYHQLIRLMTAIEMLLFFLPWDEVASHCYTV